MFWFKPVMSAPPRTVLQTVLAACFYSVEVGAAAAIVHGAYVWLKWTGVTWAVVSAILVLYPGITQSLSAALLRIAANILGSLIGFAIGSLVGTHALQVVLALAATIFIGEFLRMDLALRTACVATVIVMSVTDHSLGVSAVERLVAVLIGCATALVVQVAASPLRKYLPYLVKDEVTAKPPEENRRPRTATE